VWCCLCDPTFCRFNRTPTCDRRTQTDRQTDTDTGPWLVPRMHSGKNQSGFYWSKRQWMAMASAGLYAKSAPWLITMPAPHYSVFLQAACPSCYPTNSVKALKESNESKVINNLSGPRSWVWCLHSMSWWTCHCLQCQCWWSPPNVSVNQKLSYCRQLTCLRQWQN